ncbi:helix-turn-helix transcriptional regulator [Piscinibacter defluvii]|uniref:helix-turn-helix transcriptional regulator n=1 Tax=Piscinibacter defluvii TaxID=1796922 RepID=UPI000FDD75DA|nr:LuxR C-terminal-related transcriptional regulator [Piscinibacter defluvii]
MQIGRQVLEAFSARLLALDRVAESASPARLMRDGLEGLRALVPFEAAWWGECSGGMDGLAPRNWLSGRINLSPDFAREWNRIGHQDRFALESLRRLDTVVRSASYDDPVPAVEAFARRHDLFHALAVTRALPGSGLQQFISIYRGQDSAPFVPAEGVLFEQFSAHLMQRWSTRVALAIGGAGAARAGDGHGLLDAAGEFVYLGARLALLLQEHYPHWDGAQPPADLVEALRRAAGSLKLGARRVAVDPSGELLLLSLAPRRQAPLLPPRELSVALLYADGRSHKQIARETGLSPATVRTYLRDAYQRLGVADKVALGRALAGRRARSRTA